MKRKILLSLTTAFVLTMSFGAHAVPKGLGLVMMNGTPTYHFTACKGTGIVDQSCNVDPAWVVSMWFDPGMIIASALDLAAVKSQDEKTVDTQDALDELEEHLGTDSSGGSCGGGKTSLSDADTSAMVPDEVVAALDMEAVKEKDVFDEVRGAVENYLFYSGQTLSGCTENLKPEDCILERQHTWLLTSIVVAATTGDRLLARTIDMSADYAALTSVGQSPKAMWAGNSKITAHTHIQQNDINALYARDLEMNALNGIRESDSVRLIK